MTLLARASVVPAIVALAGWTLVAQPFDAVQGAQPPRASFTAAQAEAGRAAYDATCSGCHLRDLKGQFEAPQLAGGNFLNQWGGKTVAELHGYLMSSMPPTSPGAPGGHCQTVGPSPHPLDVLGKLGTVQRRGCPCSPSEIV